MVFTNTELGKWVRRLPLSWLILPSLDSSSAVATGSHHFPWRSIHSRKCIVHNSALCLPDFKRVWKQQRYFCLHKLSSKCFWFPSRCWNCQVYHIKLQQRSSRSASGNDLDTEVHFKIRRWSEKRHNLGPVSRRRRRSSACHCEWRQDKSTPFLEGSRLVSLLAQTI